jgi:hypothetical protein
MIPNLAKFFVFGSHGKCVADSRTGLVPCVEDNGFNDGEYESISRFDVEEWRATYPEIDLAGKWVDILDLGYILWDGTHEGPELDWRAEFRAIAKSDVTTFVLGDGL